MADYIKKQDVIEYLNEECEAGCVDQFTDHQRRECFREAVECIESIENVDAEPVRHGKWITSSIERNSSGVRPCYLFCSKCQHYQRRSSKYCPQCGAKMDGVEE